MTPGTAFDVDPEIKVDPTLLRDGANEITIRREGSGTLYAAAWMTFVSREDQIRPAGNELFVTRRYFRTTEKPTLSGTYETVREELLPGDKLESGERIEVEMTLDARNHLEYLVIEDMKAAGTEPVEVQSGWTWGRRLGQRPPRAARREDRLLHLLPPAG